jgi:tetratricopeptide (TPR) repeat protein
MTEILSEKIYAIMEREMAHIGHFIVRKQSMLIGADPDNIKPKDLPELASKLSEVMKTFGGHDKARNIYSEIKRLDNLDMIVESEQNDEKRNKMQEDLGRTCIFTGEWEKAFEYFNKLLADAERIGDRRMISRYLRRLGFIHQERSEFDQALVYYERALEEAEESENKNAIAGSCNYIGTVYWYKGNYVLAEEFLGRALKNAEIVGDMTALGAAHIGLGNLHSDLNEPDEALEHYRNSLKYLKNTEKLDQIARAYNNLGDTYLHKKDWEKALEQFEKCQKYGEEGGWVNMKAWALFNSSEALTHLGDLKKAKDYLDQSHEILKKIGDRVGIAGIHQNYGRLYRVKKEWDLSIMHYEKSIQIFTEINTPLSLAECRLEFGLTLKEKGDADEAKTELRRAVNLFQHLELDSMVKSTLKEIEALG